MNTTFDWYSNFRDELDRASKARSSGNEGQARVFARRAAGIVIREYMTRRQISPPGPSAYDLLRHFSAIPDLPEQVYWVVGHFLVRITPDHQLPIEADLIQEAGWLANTLIPNSNGGE